MQRTASTLNACNLFLEKRNPTHIQDENKNKIERQKNQ